LYRIGRYGLFGHTRQAAVCVAGQRDRNRNEFFELPLEICLLSDSTRFTMLGARRHGAVFPRAHNVFDFNAREVRVHGEK
jgi:hypothetical protein